MFKRAGSLNAHISRAHTNEAIIVSLECDIVIILLCLFDVEKIA